MEGFNEARFEPSRHNLECALGVVEDQTEWAIRLAPDSPALLADQFHAWVWNAAQPFCTDNHYRAAVHAAAVAINANTQTKVGRSDVFDDDLMSQSFSYAFLVGYQFAIVIAAAIVAVGIPVALATLRNAGRAGHDAEPTAGID